jgi:hypothetical protein
MVKLVEEIEEEKSVANKEVGDEEKEAFRDPCILPIGMLISNVVARHHCPFAPCAAQLACRVQKAQTRAVGHRKRATFDTIATESCRNKICYWSMNSPAGCGIFIHLRHLPYSHFGG